jgi:photosystem II stability/assembly factor-like uncharacterized protein
LREAQLDLEGAVFAPPLMDVWFANEQQGWASGAYGTLLHTSNGGRQWQDWSHKVDNEDELHLNGVIGAADGTLFLASEWGTIFRSSTGGESWEATDSGYEGSFFGLAVNPETNSLFAYGLRGSTDNGESFTVLVQASPLGVYGIAPTTDGHYILTGEQGSRPMTDGTSNAGSK